MNKKFGLKEANEEDTTYYMSAPSASAREKNGSKVVLYGFLKGFSDSINVMHICRHIYLEGRVILHTYLFYLSSLEHGQPGVLSMVASGMFWPAVAPAPGTGRKEGISPFATTQP